MKRIVQTLFLLAAFTFVYGQNFNPIRSGHIPFFREVGKYQVLGLKVDSLTTSGDSTFYHFHQTWDYQRATGYGYGEDECVLPNGPSWLGHNAVELSDGRFLFTNYLKDTITLKPYEEVGETWNAFNFSNGDILWATVDDIYTEEILDVESQLKEISFIRKKSNGETHPYFPENLKVIISDSLGLVTTFPFRSLVEFDSDAWPNYLWGNYELELKNFSLIQIKNLEAGETLLSNMDMYNFDIGDEFHYVNESVDGTGTDSWKHETTHRISILTDKSFNESELKITYSWENVKLYKATEWKNGEPYDIIEYSEYESSWNLNLADTIYYFPEQAICIYDNWGGEGMQYVQYYHSNNRMRVVPIEDAWIYKDEIEDPCWQYYSPYGVSGGPNGLGEGLGDLGYSYYYEWDWDKKYMVYYKKGAQTWGTPLVINSVSTIHTGTVNVYPNPVHSGEYITISAPSDSDSYSATLINMSGITLKHEKGLQGQQLWQIPSQLPAGIYILRVTDSKGSLFTTRLSIL